MINGFYPSIRPVSVPLAKLNPFLPVFPLHINIPGEAGALFSPENQFSPRWPFA
jgi:hypothetical protein